MDIPQSTPETLHFLKYTPNPPIIQSTLGLTKQNLLKKCFFSEIDKALLSAVLIVFHLLTFSYFFYWVMKISRCKQTNKFLTHVSLPTGMWNVGQKCKQFRFSLHGSCITGKCSNWILAFCKLLQNARGEVLQKIELDSERRRKKFVW